jgi:glutathione-regulated potassium-efflux system ancillary protein KefC
LAVAALLNHFSHRLFSSLETLLIRFERKVEHPAIDYLAVSATRNGWWWAWGALIFSAYLDFNRQNQRVLGLDADPTVLENLLADGRRVLYGDAGDTEL